MIDVAEIAELCGFGLTDQTHLGGSRLGPSAISTVADECGQIASGRAGRFSGRDWHRVISVVHGRCCTFSGTFMKHDLNPRGVLRSMTASSLRHHSCKDLAQMARPQGLPGGTRCARTSWCGPWSITPDGSQRSADAATAIQTALAIPVNGSRNGGKVAPNVATRTSDSTSCVRNLAEDRQLGPAKRRRDSAGKGPPGGHGPRPVLASRLLGARAAKRRTGPVGIGTTLARDDAGVARVPCGGRRHGRVASGNRDPWRRESLVRRRAESAAAISHGNRLPDGRAANSTASRGATR